MTATDGRTAQRSVGNSTRPREKHGCDARHLQTAATAADNDDVRQRRKELWEREREEERERQKSTKRKEGRGKRNEEGGQTDSDEKVRANANVARTVGRKRGRE